MAAYFRVFRSDVGLLMIVLSFSPGPLLAATWQAICGRDPLDGGLLGGVINGVCLGIVEMATTNPVDIGGSGLLYLMVFFIAGVGWGAIIGNAIRWLAGSGQTSRLPHLNPPSRAESAEESPPRYRE
jgi:hypothetical protein